MGLDAESDLALRKRLDEPPKTPAPDRVMSLRRATRALPVTTILKPALGPGKLTFDEAIYYDLYRKDIAVDDTLRYVGKRQQENFHLTCNDAHWFAAAHDKALFYMIVKGAGLPTPTTLAVTGTKVRSGFPRFLPTKDAVTAYLLENRDWPLFMKPIDGMYSIGALKVMGLVDGRLDLFDGESATAEEVALYMTKISNAGYLIQNCLLPSSFALQAFGPNVPSVRFLILFSNNEPVVESTVIKIPSGRHVADNYWRETNLLGALACETGTIERVISGTGSGVVEHQTHPVTSSQLVGKTIPDWPEICRTAINAASLFPGVRTQSWDVALTSDGPVLLEFNYGGDLNLHQLAHRRGILTESYVAHLHRCGYKKKLI